jgi:hypothetical protein
MLLLQWLLGAGVSRELALWPCWLAGKRKYWGQTPPTLTDAAGLAQTLQPPLKIYHRLNTDYKCLGSSPSPDKEES